MNRFMLLLLAVRSLAWCGGADGKGDQAAATPDASTSTPTPVRIGAI